MANIPTWPGSSSFSTGSTPFGFYDDDAQFQQDADRVAKFCATRMGYPMVAIELQEINFYTAFEEAVTTYGNEIYAYKVRQDYLSLEGTPTSSNVNNAIIGSGIGLIIKMSQQYGAEAGTGGNVEWHTGSITLSPGQQNYDLKEWAVSQSISASDLEIKRIFYQSPPAIVKYFDPYAGTGTGMMNMMDSFGWGSYSPAMNFMLMPMNFDLAKMQAIELNDTIRRSNYSFELHNNNLRIFPIPNNIGFMNFHYILKSERDSSNVNLSASDSVTNVSNVPYTNPVYSQINAIGRSWIFEYALASSKEMLGYVRGKYDSIPIPGDEVKLNSGDLISDKNNEKTNLLTKLRTYLEDTSREKLLERREKESEHSSNELKKVPFPIYIG